MGYYRYQRRNGVSRRNSFRNSARYYGQVSRYYGRRTYSRGRRYAKKANESIGLYNPGTEYIAGGAVGLTDIDNRVPAEIKLALACLPLRGGIGGKVCRFFRGMVIGDIVQHRTGFSIPVLSGALTGSSSTNNDGW